MSKLIFGIYPGGQAGSADGTLIGKPDSPDKVQKALTQLQNGNQPFIVRAYTIYVGNGKSRSFVPADVAQYVHSGRRLDLALCYQPATADLDDWKQFIGRMISEYGPYLGMLQIVEEPNNPNPDAGGNGNAPNVLEAIVEGVIAAKQEAKRQGYRFKVGFNATPSFNPADTFWSEIGTHATDEFLSALDYVGLDFFADVFRRIEPANLANAVGGLLTNFRNISLVTGRIPKEIPIHIAENGWSTGEDRPPERQAEVLETIVRIVHDKRDELNIACYEHFDLRDANSSDPNIFQQFGLLRDDYTPKPAFETYRRLIAELGADAWPDTALAH